MRARPAVLAGVIALTVAASGCGDTGEEPPTTGAQEGSTANESEAAATDARLADQVEIVDFEFDPPAITVDAGTKVTWTNEDQAAHTATTEDGSFDTGTLREGEQGTVTLDEPGSYAYICEFHPFMHGTVEVK